MLGGMAPEPPRPTAHREVPAWAWVVLLLARVWALLPLLLLAAGIWWWTHGGSKQAPRWLREAVQHARTRADSTLGR
jgi:hypothetical protein